ncbi:hypothetical protein RFI_04161 [Reticulomyxa filosa]|uniref:Uncharacterized protein n=1 Tax=Reticulomyxa filosa TaxID=46433 RepID=X6P4F4_RETFI|nr:hypothetical protein RFI_04161 [Reticulomyxa filosa]|eukprot:ETO32949.1 hypothetical protein RFI_04161 [Reticulomyxa filosa]
MNEDDDKIVLFPHTVPFETLITPSREITDERTGEDSNTDQQESNSDQDMKADQPIQQLPKEKTKKHQSKGVSNLNRIRNEEKKDEMTDNNIINSLGFKKFWDSNWRKANVKACKMVEKMIKSNEKGLITVSKDTFEMQDKDDNNLYLFTTLIKNDNTEKKKVGEFWIYNIKSKLVILPNNINIDGNVYAVNCKLQCQHENENIEIAFQQFFISKDTIIDNKLRLSISTIQWNTNLHYEIPVRLKRLFKQSRKCSKNKQFNEAISHCKKAVKISTDTFGFEHPYIADAKNYLGIAYDKKGKYDKAIECYEQSLYIRIRLFGVNHNDVSTAYHNLGVVYYKKKYMIKQLNIMKHH